MVAILSRQMSWYQMIQTTKTQQNIRTPCIRLGVYSFRSIALHYQYIASFSLRIVGSTEAIGCYKFRGKGSFSVAQATCRSTGGYLVGVDTALENRAVAGENQNHFWVFVFLFTYIQIIFIDIKLPGIFSVVISNTGSKKFAHPYSVYLTNLLRIG